MNNHNAFLPTPSRRIHGPVQFLHLIRPLLFAGIMMSWILSIAPAGWAGQATLAWNANAEQDLWGYKIYHGTSPGFYSDSVPTGLTATPEFPEYTVVNLADGFSYYFVVTALDIFGNESAFSNEVSKTIPPSIDPPPIDPPPIDPPPTDPPPTDPLPIIGDAGSPVVPDSDSPVSSDDGSSVSESHSSNELSGGAALGCGFIKPSGPPGGGPLRPIHFGILGFLAVYCWLRRVRGHWGITQS